METIEIQIELVETIDLELAIDKPISVDTKIDPFLAQQIGDLLSDKDFLLTYQISKL